MSSAQIQGIIRGILMFAAGFAAQYGIDNATWATIAGSIAALGGAAWSIYSNSTKTMVEEVVKDPGVTQVVLEDPFAAAAITSGKVVAHDSETDF